MATNKNNSINLHDPDFQKKILENLQTIFSRPQTLSSDFYIDVVYRDETEKIEYYKKLNLPIYIVDLPKPELVFSSGKGVHCEDRQYYRHQKNNS